MEKELQMTLNRLPAPTWNWLKMNESQVTYKGTPVCFPAKVDISGEGVAHAKGNVDGWQQIASGVGADLGVLAGESFAETDILESCHFENNSSDGKETEQAFAVVTYDYGAEDGVVVSENSYANRLYLHAKENTTLNVTMVLTGREDQAGSAAVQVKAYAEKNSNIHIYAVQLLGQGFTCFHDLGGICEENAAIELVRVELGAGKLYAGGEVDLKGNESSFEAHIGYHAKAGQKLDMNYTVRHHGKKTGSLMEASGILEEHSSKLFRGTIDFLPGCAGAKGDEREDILMLGDDLINQTIPLILCQEEDVEGNHGASMGKLDDSVLYYLSSRGIPEEKAEQIMARAKIDAVCERIPQKEVRSLVKEYLGTEEDTDETV